MTASWLIVPASENTEIPAVSAVAVGTQNSCVVVWDLNADIVDELKVEIPSAADRSHDSKSPTRQINIIAFTAAKAELLGIGYEILCTLFVRVFGVRSLQPKLSHTYLGLN